MEVWFLFRTALYSPPLGVHERTLYSMTICTPLNTQRARQTERSVSFRWIVTVSFFLRLSSRSLRLFLFISMVLLVLLRVLGKIVTILASLCIFPLIFSFILLFFKFSSAFQHLMCYYRSIWMFLASYFMYQCSVEIVSDFALHQEWKKSSTGWKLIGIKNNHHPHLMFNNNFVITFSTLECIEMENYSHVKHFTRNTCILIGFSKWKLKLSCF